MTDALHQALTTRRISESGGDAAGLIHHSDAGSQYTSLSFTAELLEHGMAGSIGAVNLRAQRFWVLLDQLLTQPTVIDARDATKNLGATEAAAPP